MNGSEVLNLILIPGLVGLGSLVVWLVKFYIPARERRKDLELEARLANHKDRREHSQTSENVAISILESIIRESIQEHSKEMKAIDQTMYRLDRQVDNLSQTVRALVGVISNDA